MGNIINRLKYIKYQLLKTIPTPPDIKLVNWSQEMLAGILTKAEQKGVDLTQHTDLTNTFLSCTISWDETNPEKDGFTVSKGNFYVDRDIDDLRQPIRNLNESYFITTWKTDNTGYTVTNSSQVKLPLRPGGTYEFCVDWGDDTFDIITEYNQLETIHSYNIPGTYDISINGICEGWGFYFSGEDSSKIIDVKQWGNVKLYNQGYQFCKCDKLINFSATDQLDTSNITQLFRAFENATLFNSNINYWDTSNVIDMGNAFKNCINFNQPLDNWNTSKNTRTASMFTNASSFNQDLNSWDMSKVKWPEYMFQNATSFNGNITSWTFNELYTLNFSNMFANAIAFNQDIGSWNTNKVTAFSDMFVGASSFNQDISSWDTSNAINFIEMFKDAISFDQDLSTWDISSLTNARDMFTNCTLSTINYDAILNGWVSLDTGETSIPTDININFGNSQYSSAGEAARNLLIDTYDWEISDGGLTS